MQVYELELSQWNVDKWISFKSDDVQLEIIMLDPYLRLTLNATKSSPSGDSTRYTAEFRLPDVYGVFKFEVAYQRYGLTWLLVTETLPVLPFRHNEYDRFLPVAYPYYTSAFSMMTGFLIFSAVYLYNKEPIGSRGTTSSEGEKLKAS